MEKVFKTASENRNNVMTKAKIRHDRNIRKFEYEEGDLVLCDHPRLKKGLAKVLAHKYYGPFQIMKKNTNQVDYVIKRLGSPGEKSFQVHKNRLKIYFGNDKENTKIQPQTEKRDVKSKKNKLLDEGNEVSQKTGQPGIQPTKKSQQKVKNFRKTSNSSNCPKPREFRRYCIAIANENVLGTWFYVIMLSVLSNGFILIAYN